MQRSLLESLTFQDCQAVAMQPLHLWQRCLHQTPPGTCFVVLMISINTDKLLNTWVLDCKQGQTFGKTLLVSTAHLPPTLPPPYVATTCYNCRDKVFDKVNSPRKDGILGMMQQCYTNYTILRLFKLLHMLHNKCLEHFGAHGFELSWL